MSGIGNYSMETIFIEIYDSCTFKLSFFIFQSVFSDGLYMEMLIIKLCFPWLHF